MIGRGLSGFSCGRLPGWSYARFFGFKKGEHALALPEAEDPYYSWWKNNLYQCLRRRISDNPGETTMLTVTLASFFLASAIFIPKDWSPYLYVLLIAAYGYILLVGVFYAAYLSLRGGGAIGLTRQPS